MSEYDSILKEKKKKKEPIIKVEPPKKKKFPTISLSIISVIIALIISYIVYYNTILAQDKIIINNLNTLRKAYQNIFNNLNLDSFNNDNIEGLITYNETNNYSFIKDKDNYYLKTPSLNKYINNKYATGVNINVDNILENVSKDKYIKTFYLEGKVPVVQIDLVLERVELEKIIGMKLINEYEAIITSRNHALTNEILSIKVVINNKITIKNNLLD